METAAVTYYWVRFGIVVLIAVIVLISVFRRSRRKAARHDLVVGLISVALMGGALYLGRVAADWIVVGSLAGAGLVLGVLLGRIRPVLALLVAVLTVFGAIMVLFGEPKAIGVGLGALAMVATLQLGQGFRGPGKQVAAVTPTPVGVPQAPVPVAPVPATVPAPMPPAEMSAPEPPVGMSHSDADDHGGGADAMRSSPGD